MAWLSDFVYCKVDGRERLLLRVHCVVLRVLKCDELLAANVMPDHATFVDYVIPSQRMSWP